MKIERGKREENKTTIRFLKVCLPFVAGARGRQKPIDQHRDRLFIGEETRIDPY